MRPAPTIGVVLVIAAIAYGTCHLRNESLRRETFERTMQHANALEAASDFARAAEAYEVARELDLTARERAELRYRLANALIRSGGLQRAMGVLEELSEQDVAEFQIDIGPLYRDLGDRAKESGNLPLATLAYRLGQAVSPNRMEEFGRRREQLLRESSPEPDSP